MITFIRKNILSIILLVLVLTLFLYSFIFQPKIVYVDSGKLLNGYKAMVQARAEIEKKQSVWKANIDSLTQDVQDGIKKYEKTFASGSDKEKQLAKELIGSKQKDLYDYQNAIKQNAGQEEQRVTQNVFSTVNTYLVRYGKEHGYKMILIASNGNIGYGDESLDITDKVVEELNREYFTPAK